MLIMPEIKQEYVSCDIRDLIAVDGKKIHYY